MPDFEGEKSPTFGTHTRRESCDFDTFVEQLKEPNLGLPKMQSLKPNNEPAGLPKMESLKPIRLSRDQDKTD